MILTVLIATTIAKQNLGALTDSEKVKSPFDPAMWTLVWSDEFDKPGLPNPKNWTYEEGYIRNDEKQYYTKSRKENARVEEGNLIIECRKDNFDGKPITSASLTTQGKHSLKYGRIEIRAKIPAGKGTWPAAWTLGENISQVGWPKCGEIDIMENVGFNPNSIHANIHTGAYNHMIGTGKGSAIEHKSPSSDFHVYAVDWYPHRLEFFFDDTRYFVYKKTSDDTKIWPFAQNHYLIINFAFGGAWGGAQGIDESVLPLKYQIDYVRYYKRN